MVIIVRLQITIMHFIVLLCLHEVVFNTYWLFIIIIDYLMEYGPEYTCFKCFNIIANGSTAVHGALKIKTFSYHFISIVWLAINYTHYTVYKTTTLSCHAPGRQAPASSIHNSAVFRKLVSFTLPNIVYFVHLPMGPIIHRATCKNVNFVYRGA